MEPWLSEDDFVALAFARDGSSSGTMTVEIAAYDFQNELKILDLELVDIATLPVPDELFNKTDVAVDDQGRITVVFTEVPSGAPAKIRAQRVDAGLGTLGDLFDVNLDAADAEVALLDPFGNRLVVPSIPTNSGAADFGKIQANFVDLSGPTPVVEPEFTVSTTPAPFPNIRPAVAADPVTGAFTVSWDFVTGASGDPSDIRARRYDDEGLPLGDDFVVNVKPILADDNSQGQSDVAYGPGGLSVIVWAADGATGDPDLDVFARVFLPDGSPIVDPSFPLLAGQFRVNTGNTPGGPLSDRQDRPKVRFLPEPDATGRPQFAVVWRDVGDGDGSDPNGTGTTTRCFSIDGLEDVPIFEDGFESGDTSSWSASTP